MTAFFFFFFWVRMQIEVTWPVQPKHVNVTEFLVSSLIKVWESFTFSLSIYYYKSRNSSSAPTSSQKDLQDVGHCRPLNCGFCFSTKTCKVSQRNWKPTSSKSSWNTSCSIKRIYQMEFYCGEKKNPLLASSPRSYYSHFEVYQSQYASN